MSRRAAICLGLVALAACGPPSERRRSARPSALSRAAVIFSLELKGRGFPYFRSRRAQSAYFAQVIDGRIDQDHPLPSTDSSNGYVYLLDVPPGRYAPISASYYLGRTRYMARFDTKTALDWSVEAEPGEIAFMGEDFVYFEFVDFSTMLLNVLKGAAAFLPPFRRPTVPLSISGARHEGGALPEARALRAARRRLAGWDESLSRRLAQLGDPQEATQTGLVFKKAVAAVDAGRFRYVDTLGWGPALQVAGGLEWHEPKGRARLAVVFRDAQEPAFKPQETYLAEMRAAGSPEDAHVLAEVRVSTRTAYSARYTTYSYPEGTLVGSRAKVFETETLLVPDPEGYFLLRFRAERDDFSRLYPDYRRFLRYLAFGKEKKA